MEGLLKDIEFDEKKINEDLEKVNSSLKEYIKTYIFPEYNLNDNGHNQQHINYVLKRAFELDDGTTNKDILYTCVCFHDIACHIDREQHEVLSANRVLEDTFLNKYFNKHEIRIIHDAIEDHRASLEYEPRNIYGKILSSADRKVEVKQYLIASMSFQKHKCPNTNKSEIIEHSYNFAIKKFGKNGYAVKKMYVNDYKYEKFLMNIQYLIDNKKEFEKLASVVYNAKFLQSLERF